MAQQRKDHYTDTELEDLLAAEQSEADAEGEDDNPEDRPEIQTYSGFADGGVTPRFLDDENVPYEDSLS